MRKEGIKEERGGKGDMQCLKMARDSIMQNHKCHPIKSRFSLIDNKKLLEDFNSEQNP